MSVNLHALPDKTIVAVQTSESKETYWRRGDEGHWYPIGGSTDETRDLVKHIYPSFRAPSELDFMKPAELSYWPCRVVSELELLAFFGERP